MALILSGDTGVPASGMPTGSVIQTVTATTSSQVSTTSTSFVTSGFSASITPISTASKIAIYVTLGDVAANGAGANGVGIALYRNGSQIGVQMGNQWCYQGSSSGYTINSGNFNWLDSPASTSSVTYTIYYKVAGGGTTALLFRDGTQGSIILQEIKV